MPSSDAIPPTAESYLRRVLRQGLMPFRYRSGVRSLLGIPTCGEDAIIGAAGAPPIEFRYALPQSLAPMAATELLTAEQWLDAALDDPDSDKERNPSTPRGGAVAAPSPQPDSAPATVAPKAAGVGAAPSPRLDPTPAAVAPKAALPQVTPDVVSMPILVSQAGEPCRSGTGRARQTPQLEELLGHAGHCRARPVPDLRVLPPRSGQELPALAPRAALLQVPPVDVVSMPILVSQTGEPPSENLSTTRVSAVGAALPPRSEQEPPALAPKAAPPQVTPVDLAPANQAGERRFEAVPAEPVGVSAAIPPAATWQRAAQTPQPGQLRRLSPGTGPTHPHATGAATPLQAKALTPGELMAEAGWADQPTTITIPGRVTARRPASTAEAATDRDNSTPGGTSVASPSAVSTSNPSTQVVADERRHTSNVVGAALAPRPDPVPAAVTPKAAGVGAVLAPRPDPAPAPRPDPVPAAVTPRTARPQLIPDNPPAVGVTTGAYPSARSAAEQIARLQRTVAELTAQVATQRNLKPEGAGSRTPPQFGSGGPPPPQFTSRDRTPRSQTPRAFWERSYLNRLYRWSGR